MEFDEFEKILRARDDVVFGKGVPEHVVRHAEERLGLSFPSSVRKNLMRFGYLELGHYELFGLGEGVPDFLRLVEIATSERTETGCPLRRDLVPLLNDGGGNLYCVATTDENVGAVVFWDHSAGSAQEPDVHAPSLDAWIGEMLDDLDDEL